MADEPIMPILRMRIMRELNMSSSPLETARLAAGCLAQISARPLPTPDSSIDACVRIIAASVPLPFGIHDALPAEVASVIAQSRDAISPAAIPAPAASILPAAPPPSEAAREDATRYTVLHGVKFPRAVDGPYQVFYPHLWVGPGRTHERWNAQWD